MQIGYVTVTMNQGKSGFARALTTTSCWAKANRKNRKLALGVLISPHAVLQLRFVNLNGRNTQNMHPFPSLEAYCRRRKCSLCISTGRISVYRRKSCNTADDSCTQRYFDVHLTSIKR